VGMGESEMEVSLTIYIRIRVRQHLPHCGLCSRKQRDDVKWEHSSHDVETRGGGSAWLQVHAQ